MDDPDIDARRIDARRLLRDVASRSKALARLRVQNRPHALLPPLSIVLAVAALDAGSDAAPWVKVLAGCACGIALDASFETWRLSRRVDALATLALQDDARRAARHDDAR